MFSTRDLASALSALVALGLAGGSAAQVVPPDFTAAPDVYKVVAENAQYRFVEGTWKPGQRDAFHSHPAKMTYAVTDCTMRVHFPDGTQRDSISVAGQASDQPPVASHSLENVGKSVCKMVMVEPK